MLLLLLVLLLVLALVDVHPVAIPLTTGGALFGVCACALGWDDADTDA